MLFPGTKRTAARIPDIRIVLRHQHKPLYLGASGRWVDDPHAALAFANAIRALHYCVLNHLQAEVVPIVENRKRKTPARAAALLDSGEPSAADRWRPMAGLGLANS